MNMILETIILQERTKIIKEIHQKENAKSISVIMFMANAYRDDRFYADTFDLIAGNLSHYY